MTPRRMLVALSILAAVASACDRRDRLAAPDSTATQPTTPPARSAFLSVSSMSPEPGDTVVIAGTVSLDETLSLGSFRVRLAFDSSALSFVDEVETPGMMRVVHARGADVIVVGAAAGASSDGRLFTLRFRVHDRAGASSLALAIDELNDGSFIDRSRVVTRSSRLMHDPSLARKASK
jgi:hypothetical protein